MVHVSHPYMHQDLTRDRLKQFISSVLLCCARAVALQGLQQELGVDEGADEAGDVASALHADPAPHADAVLQVDSSLPFQPAGRADDGDQQSAGSLAG